MTKTELGRAIAGTIYPDDVLRLRTLVLGKWDRWQLKIEGQQPQFFDTQREAREAVRAVPGPRAAG